MDKDKLKIEQEKTRKTRKIVTRFVSIIIASAMIAGTGITIYKLKKGEKIGNTKFSIEKSIDDNKVKMKIK